MQQPQSIGYRRLRKEVGDVAPAAFKHPEDVARLDGFPGGQRIQQRQDALGDEIFLHLLWQDRPFEDDADAIGRVGLAKDVIFKWQNAVVVGGTPPQHGARRVQASDGCLDDRLMTGAAGEIRHSVVGRVHESYELRCLPVQQGVGVLRVCAVRKMPVFRIGRQNVGSLVRAVISRTAVTEAAADGYRSIATVAIRATQAHCRACVHGLVVGAFVAGNATVTFRPYILRGLPLRCRRCRSIVAVNCMAALAGSGTDTDAARADKQCKTNDELSKEAIHQNTNTRLSRK